MARTYVPERQSEYWTSRGIEQTLLAEGFSVQTIPLSQNVERELPTDFLFAVSDGSGPVKLFGLQYKALYQNGKDHWPVSGRQHEDILKIPWISYCLSEMRSLDEEGAAIHHCVFVTPTDVSPPRVDARPQVYARWAGFLANLRLCRVGVVVENEEQVRTALTGPDRQSMPQQLLDLGIDTFILDFASKNALHVTVPFPTAETG